MSILRLPVATVLLLLALSVPASALASVAAEEQAGEKLAQHVQAGTRTCDSLTEDDLEHIGEFVMAA